MVERHLTTHNSPLHAMASLPHLSVAGAIATATHGSGDTLGNLTTAVTAVQVCDAQGALRELTEADEQQFNTILLASCGADLLW